MFIISNNSEAQPEAPITVRAVYDAIDGVSPYDTQESYDNSGLGVGDFSAAVKGVTVALDATAEAIAFASANGHNLLVTHHPSIFTPVKAIPTRSIPYILAANNMNHLSAHTNFDASHIGYLLLKKLGFTKSYSLARSVMVTKTDAPISADALAQRIKSALGCGCVRYFDSGKPIEKIAIVPGAGGSFLPDARTIGASALISGDIKHSTFIDAQTLGISVFDAGHRETEIMFVEFMEDFLRQNFVNLNVKTFRQEPIKTL